MAHPYISYQITFEIEKDSEIIVGKLGKFVFPKGIYIYTGSAKSNIDKRISRHKSKTKKMHWHIDYVLVSPSCKIISIEKSELPECRLNQTVEGEIIVPGFGSSDCKNKCQSHLKRLVSGTE